MCFLTALNLPRAVLDWISYPVVLGITMWARKDYGDGKREVRYSGNERNHKGENFVVRLIRPN